jgi:hypothetical protein
VNVNSVVLSCVGPAAILNWKFEGEAESLRHCVGGGDIEKIDVGVVLDERVVYFVGIRVEITERMKIPVRN